MSVVDDARLREVLSRYADLLVEDYEVGDALQDLVEGVTRVMGVFGAGVSVDEGGTLGFATASPEQVSVMERIQDETGTGPRVLAHEKGEPVMVPDLAEMAHQWPALVRAALEVGLVSTAGIPMHLNGNRVGVLNLYHDERIDWTDEDVSVARLLADVATGYVVNATRLEAYRQLTEQLQEALESRVVIEQAKGILAGERGVSLDEAFNVMRAHARDRRATMRSVADAVVTLGLRP